VNLETKDTDMMKPLPRTLPFAIIGTFVLVSSPAFALRDSPLSLGPKLGLNYSHLTGDLSEEAGYKLGFVGGAFIAYAFSDWFTLQPEVLYSQKGAKATWQVRGEERTETVSLDYVEIPVLAVLTIPTQSRWTPRVFAGPAFGFLISAEDIREVNGVEVGREDIKEGFKDYDIGIVFGGGLDVKVGPGAITTDLRYNFGVTNIVDDDDNGDSVKNGVFSFLVGYAF
jgi:hypothetical protein